MVFPFFSAKEKHQQYSRNKQTKIFEEIADLYVALIYGAFLAKICPKTPRESSINATVYFVFYESKISLHFDIFTYMNYKVIT